MRSGHRRRPRSDRLPEGVHGRHARLADRAAAGRHGRRDHERRGARGHRARAAGSAGRSAVHAIGDRANRNALDAFEQTADEWRPRGLRHRIEHAQCLAPEDVGAFRARSGSPRRCSSRTPPPTATSPSASGPSRLDDAYAWRSLLDAGAVLANGSDAPIEELDPLAGISAGVLRTLDERPAWRPEQAVTVEEALHATCVAPAWLTGDEHRRGKLLPGYLADLVVLDRDPVDMPAGGARGGAGRGTMVGGRWLTTRRPGSSACASRSTELDAGRGLPRACDDRVVLPIASTEQHDADLVTELNWMQVEEYLDATSASCSRSTSSTLPVARDRRDRATCLPGRCRSASPTPVLHDVPRLRACPLRLETSSA